MRYCVDLEQAQDQEKIEGDRLTRFVYGWEGGSQKSLLWQPSVEGWDRTRVNSFIVSFRGYQLPMQIEFA